MWKRRWLPSSFFVVSSSTAPKSLCPFIFLSCLRKCVPSLTFARRNGQTSVLTSRKRFMKSQLRLFTFPSSILLCNVAILPCDPTGLYPKSIFWFEPTAGSKLEPLSSNSSEYRQNNYNESLCIYTFTYIFQVFLRSSAHRERRSTKHTCSLEVWRS